MLVTNFVTWKNDFLLIETQHIIANFVNIKTKLAILKIDYGNYICYMLK